ncbi:hypothetical protein ACJMK2_039340 [Sinanodonta woodiana]|uniref:IgGFc-binding protein N-terminal domain-containing protein n=1 Tax=Sinanodonta woodiana TaxID=1069815 RepID=A0ABD3WF22_SINWO
MHTCQILIIIYLIIMANGIVFRLEVDTGRTKTNHQILDLSNATNGKAVLLQNGEHLSLTFCLRTSSVVQVSDFRFSNGNETDTVIVTIDDEIASIFATNKSTDWNIFFYPGDGLNTVQVFVNVTDGLAVDYIEIDVEDDLRTQEIAMCQVTCVNDFNPNWPNKVVSEGLSFAMQKSYRTACSKVSNVHIPIFDKLVKTYEITATIPQYKSFYNPRNENISECYHLYPFMWTFKSIIIYNDMSESIRSEKTDVYFSGGLHSSTGSHSQLNVTFNVEGKSRGMTDADRGSILTIQLSGITEQTVVQMEYKGRAALSSIQQKILSASVSEASWSIPDFTWSDTNLNLIRLYINTSSPLPLTIYNLSLAKETIAARQSPPESMELALSNRDSYSNVSYFRIHIPTIWNPGYAQLFVMYIDGNARLLPIPPDGVDWIPFGSSVIIGQSNPSHVRPYAAINNVFLNIQSLQMKVTYKDGGSARLELQNNLIETRVIVSDIIFGQNSNYPIATFGSMYIADGNCGVDHVKANNANPRHIMEDFGYLLGRSFIFYRKCTS